MPIINTSKGVDAMVSYAHFFRTLKEKKISIYALVQKKGINANTINCIKKGKSITTYTLENLCKALDCQIPDIVEYIPDEDSEQHNQEI